jgi:hypothetical protein
VGDFQLDTSGIVPWCAEYPDGVVSYIWTDLDPFTQGALTAALEGGRPLIALRGDSQNPFRAPRFSDLAPSTLQRFIEDCAAHEKAYPLQAHDPRRRNRGFNFWRNRQAGMWAKSGWPPLTLYIGDDGLIYAREADRG